MYVLDFLSLIMHLASINLESETVKGPISRSHIKNYDRPRNLLLKIQSGCQISWDLRTGKGKTWHFETIFSRSKDAIGLTWTTDSTVGFSISLSIFLKA